MQKNAMFNGELLIEIPSAVYRKCQSSPLLKALFITKMGYYSRAVPHNYERIRGIDQLILVYCILGKGEVQMSAGSGIVLEAGEVLLIPRNTPHTCVADPADPWSIYWFHLDGQHADDLLQAFTHELKEAKQVLSVGFLEENHLLFKQMANALRSGFSNHHLQYANLSFWYYLGTLLTPGQFEKIKHPKPELSTTEQAIQFMQDNLDAALTLEQIAQAVYRSPSVFCRKFKADMGLSPIVYYNQLRAQKASQLLRHTDLRISEIAAQMGIYDPAYFSRLFKQQLKVSPSEYRNQLQVKV